MLKNENKWSTKAKKMIIYSATQALAAQSSWIVSLVNIAGVRCRTDKVTACPSMLRTVLVHLCWPGILSGLAFVWDNMITFQSLLVDLCPFSWLLPGLKELTPLSPEEHACGLGLLTTPTALSPGPLTLSLQWLGEKHPKLPPVMTTWASLMGHRHWHLLQHVQRCSCKWGKPRKIRENYRLGRCEISVGNSTSFHPWKCELYGHFFWKLVFLLFNFIFPLYFL